MLRGGHPEIRVRILASTELYIRPSVSSGTKLDEIDDAGAAVVVADDAVDVDYYNDVNNW